MLFTSWSSSSGQSANFNKLNAPALQVGCAWEAVSWLHNDMM